MADVDVVVRAQRALADGKALAMIAVVPELIAEVERLRGLVHEADWLFAHAGLYRYVESWTSRMCEWQTVVNTIPEPES